MSSDTVSRQSPHAPTSPKKGRRKKDKDGKKEEKHREKENEKARVCIEPEAPKIVTCNFAGNEYEGIMTTDWAGCRYLEGTARYTWADGIKYEGPFVASHIDGRGKFTWPDGSTYEGDVKDGKRHGEGIYVGADAVTKYEGQWLQGKRHGIGRLSYDIIGESHFHGCWEDGWKHGDGRQVWPSGNVYEGQWRFGKMSGQGTMTWKDGGTFEQYCGNWENNMPQGIGTHTWHAPEPRPDPNGKEGPTQQMNNRYYGEWNKSLRHGQGDFYYANGAKFSGVWTDNVKHGQGKYTFEDGKVYSGPFINDQMKDYTQPDSLKGAALNIGAEDNPIRRCIDISDLEPYALPPDVGGIDLALGTGYDESQEGMREVHNMLLRHLGELKQVYCHYRKVFPRNGEDPFVLSMHQVWIIARDFDLLTPTCSLSALNRCTLSGPRHHQEVASEEEIHDLRPLTPRSEHHHHKRESTERIESRASPSMCHDTSTSQLSADGKQHTSSAHEDGEDGSSDYSGYSTIPPSRGDTEAEQPPEAEQEGVEQKRHQSTLIARSSLWSSMPTITPVQTKFWRKEDASDLVNIHSPTIILMFRHFIELFVRVALVRYPNEPGLEHQVRRLFKETLVPRFGKPAGSESVFQFLMDIDIQQVFKAVSSELWDIFKVHAVGEGSYGPPPWVSHLAHAQDNNKAVGTTEDVAKDSVMRTAEDAAKDTKPEVGPSPSPDFAAKMSQLGTSLPSDVRLRRHGLGGQQRRLHVKARLDVTIRIKDVLRLLDKAGFLLPPGPKEKYPPYSVDIHSSVFLDLEEPQDASQFQQSQESFMPDLAGLKGLLPNSPSPTDAHQDLADGENIETEGHSVKKSVGMQPPPPLDLEFGNDTELANTSPPVAQQTTSYEVPTADVLNCDFTVTIVEVLRILLEVVSPESIAKLCWAVRGEDAPMDQCIGVLDFVETELTYFEFQRLLLRMSERKTKQLETSGEFPLHRRLEGFMKHVFLPSLEKPYTSPQIQNSEETEPVIASEQPETAPSLQPLSRQVSPTAPSPSPQHAIPSPKNQPEIPETEAHTTSEELAPEVRTFEIWQGFEGLDLHELEEIGALRAWPDDYDQNVAAWE